MITLCTTATDDGDREGEIRSLLAVAFYPLDLLRVLG
jgi:hypothetical protein